jgi:hypothetical protein
MFTNMQSENDLLFTLVYSVLSYLYVFTCSISVLVYNKTLGTVGSACGWASFRCPSKRCPSAIKVDRQKIRGLPAKNTNECFLREARETWNLWPIIPQRSKIKLYEYPINFAPVFTDPCLWLMDPDSDPDADPAIFIIDLQRKTNFKKSFFFSLYFLKVHLHNF